MFISHGDCQDEAELLADKVRKTMGVEKIVISNIGAVIGSSFRPRHHRPLLYGGSSGKNRRGEFQKNQQRTDTP